MQPQDGMLILYYLYFNTLNADQVDKFEWTNPDTKIHEVYTNCNQFTLNGKRLESFCLMYGNDVKLVKQHYIDILKADYNVALNVGSKHDRIIKKSKLYLLKDKNLVEFNNKSSHLLIAGKGEKVKEFVKKNHLNFNKENDLRSLVDIYNSIIYRCPT